MDEVAAASPQDALVASAVPKGRLRPLVALAPYVARYRGRAVLALISLTVAALTTLLVPVAVRRLIDFGFTPDGIALINSYFSVMIAVVAVLALASASRYYLVMTIGERIVADLRRDVFGHLLSLSPAFFDSARSGELISRLTADTTQIKSAVGASVSIALRNVINVFNPEAIVLDGFLGVIHSLPPRAPDSAVASEAMAGPDVQVLVSRAALGSDLLMIGAAELAFAGLLADPAGYSKAHSHP